MVTAAIICAAAGAALLVAGLVLLSRDDGPGAEWRERTADTAADFRDWLRLGR
jgi:hypothetical protein